ncbi:SAM-dependent methyltransferase [Streptomyces sp. NPDC056909]|uniref:SAM-dependent methyltransferase n=1 Tax=Streptomyces sp. NPDC056909 TaxID=3345963 RepID=UPI0036B3FCD6
MAERVRSDIAHNARVWNYWLGGKDNCLVDREVGDRITGMYPGIREVARADRAFLGRAVGLLARDRGVRQFLDIGTGLPTVDNTHEVAQRIAPGSRIVQHRRITARGRADIASFVAGLELLEPGIVSCARWRPDPDEEEVTAEVAQFGLVARKP